MPVIVSTKCTMTRADVTRVSRNRLCELFWNQRARKYSGISAMNSTTPLTQSSENIAIAMNPMYNTPWMSWLMPESSNSRMVSRSLV